MWEAGIATAVSEPAPHLDVFFIWRYSPRLLFLLMWEAGFEPA